MHRALVRAADNAPAAHGPQSQTAGGLLAPTTNSNEATASFRPTEPGRVMLEHIPSADR